MLWRDLGPVTWLYYREWSANTGTNTMWRLWGLIAIPWLYYRVTCYRVTTLDWLLTTVHCINISPSHTGPQDVRSSSTRCTQQIRCHGRELLHRGRWVPAVSGQGRGSLCGGPCCVFWGGSLCGDLCLRLLSRWSSICITQTYCKSHATQFSGCIFIAGLWSFCEQQCSDTRSQGFLQVTRAAGQIL